MLDCMRAWLRPFMRVLGVVSLLLWLPWAVGHALSDAANEASTFFHQAGSIGQGQPRHLQTHTLPGPIHHIQESASGVFVSTGHGLVVLEPHPRGAHILHRHEAERSLDQGYTQDTLWITRTTSGRGTIAEIAFQGHLLRRNRLLVAPRWESQLPPGHFIVPRGPTAEAPFVVHKQHQGERMTVTNTAGEIIWSYTPWQRALTVSVAPPLVAVAEHGQWTVFRGESGELLQRGNMRGTPLANPYVDASLLAFPYRDGDRVRLGGWQWNADEHWDLPLPKERISSEFVLTLADGYLLLAANQPATRTSRLTLLEATSGHMLWTAEWPQLAGGPPLMLGEVIYLPWFGQITAINRQHGDILWQERMPDIVTGVHFLAAAEQLWVTTANRELHLFGPPVASQPSDESVD